ncbi:D-2-hydroxyglutarate dehydrogenase, mitochondrial-like [Watersipora subatra]|uniref:D-2-hydroxyglutarate dehydrogenase, mitochondrial-like n=1 Tax=Watersipora subatra TaxID=2589382 RepID=UPI00355B2C23
MAALVKQLLKANRTSHAFYSTNVALTTSRYPGLKRKEFGVVVDKDVKFFENIVGAPNVIRSDLDGYNTDWLRTVRGESETVLRPGCVEEVSALVKYCYERNLAICPQGGNTGLVGGSVPVFDEVILSTERLNKIKSIDPTAGILQCEAGCVLETLDEELSKHDLMMPLDLGAKGSCHIGGNLSTNAGGIRLLRYGSLHGNTLGLEVVLANGEILDNMNPLIKDNTGYDLKHLFIGAEGTLGLITAATIKCPTRPSSINAAMIGVEKFETCLKVLSLTKKYVGEILSGFEFMDLATRQVVCDNLGLSYPLAEFPYYLLIETSGSDEEHDKAKLDTLLEHLMGNELIADGTVARDVTQRKHMWTLRETAAEALLHDGYCYKYDISLPQPVWYDLVREMRTRIEGSAALRCIGYGHLGDGNLHLNITSAEYDQHVMDLIEPFLYDWTSAHNGSISAEHGLGFKKKQYIYHSKSKEMVNLMKVLKQTLDPKGILNPYKYLPEG